MKQENRDIIRVFLFQLFGMSSGLIAYELGVSVLWSLHITAAVIAFPLYFVLKVIK